MKNILITIIILITISSGSLSQRTNTFPLDDGALHFLSVFESFHYNHNIFFITRTVEDRSRHEYKIYYYNHGSAEWTAASDVLAVMRPDSGGLLYPRENHYSQTGLKIRFPDRNHLIIIGTIDYGYQNNSFLYRPVVMLLKQTGDQQNPRWEIIERKIIDKNVRDRIHIREQYNPDTNQTKFIIYDRHNGDVRLDIVENNSQYRFNLINGNYYEGKEYLE
ncbi:hypothetical protein QA597_10525 [Marinilabiliaceae bacterium ANBcel2]|nr:hypothetical protein [Marinilabiliaceae bacterium ANBcel2]